VPAVVPFQRADRFNYFEVTVISVGDRHEVVIGLTNEDYDLNALPGWHYEFRNAKEFLLPGLTLTILFIGVLLSMEILDSYFTINNQEVNQ